MSTMPLPHAPLVEGHRLGGRATLYQRLMLAYAGVLLLALLALLFAPIRVSVPIRVGEALVLCAGGAIMLMLFHVLLRRALDPLGRLTLLMQRVDPLAPGQRLALEVHDAEVAALADAFNAMLDRLEGERRDSARRALAAQEGERRRIARELHDEVGQVLTGLVLRSETLARRADDDLRGDLEELREAARRGAEDVRSIARRLRPEALDELGLQSALLALCSAVAQRSDIRFTRRLARDLPLTAEQELVIYRVAQESITNVVRHADASSVELRLDRADDGAVVLIVRDDGVGMPADVDPDSNGLRGMRERALLVGGEVRVSRDEPRGTVVVLRLPSEELPS